MLCPVTDQSRSTKAPNDRDRRPNLGVADVNPSGRVFDNTRVRRLGAISSPQGATGCAKDNIMRGPLVIDWAREVMYPIAFRRRPPALTTPRANLNAFNSDPGDWRQVPRRTGS